MIQTHRNPCVNSLRQILAGLRIVLSILLLCLIAGPSFAQVTSDANGNLVGYTKATMSDEVEIALAVGYPKGFDPEDEEPPFPTSEPDLAGMRTKLVKDFPNHVVFYIEREEAIVVRVLRGGQDVNIEVAKNKRPLAVGFRHRHKRSG